MAIRNPKLNILFLWKNLFKIIFFVCLSPSLFASEIRIVSLSPAITELLFELDLDKNIVGTSSYSNFPEAAKKIPVVGSYLQPSIEKIIRLNPTHVLVFKEGDPSIEESLKKANLNFIVFESRTLEDYEDFLKKLGALFNVEKKTQTVLQLWKTQWAMLATLPKIDKKIMIQVDHNPIFVAGVDTFISKSFEKCGLKNTFSNVTGYQKIQMESVLNRRPDTILVLGQLNEFDSFKSVKDFWKNNPITKNSSIVRGNSDELSRLTSRLPSAVIKTCNEIRSL